MHRRLRVRKCENPTSLSSLITISIIVNSIYMRESHLCWRRGRFGSVGTRLARTSPDWRTTWSAAASSRGGWSTTLGWYPTSWSTFFLQAVLSSQVVIWSKQRNLFTGIWYEKSTKPINIWVRNHYCIDSTVIWRFEVQNWWQSGKIGGKSGKIGLQTSWGHEIGLRGWLVNWPSILKL